MLLFWLLLITFLVGFSLNLQGPVTLCDLAAYGDDGVDPCLYILRFAAKLEFGPKTQEVANTALRLVQRMKRDSIHSGRRPSGLCGAALLMAARLHEYNRTTGDIVKIVKVHESTLRKRLIEFSDTPSSSLTLEEFLTVDLEEEQDPPSFKAARKKDKERLQRLMEEEADSITELQKDIEAQLDKDSKSRKRSRNVEGSNQEDEDTTNFIEESTMGTINQIMEEGKADDPSAINIEEPIKELGPDIASMCLVGSLDEVVQQSEQSQDFDITFDDIDDDEIDSYIMNDDEVKHKDGLWHKLNASYLEEQKIKEEKLAKEKEEGKPEKKKRRVTRKKHVTGPSNSAGEAIEKMLQEKKVSSKINYDVLRSLTALKAEETHPVEENPTETLIENKELNRRRLLSHEANASIRKAKGKSRAKPSIGLPLVPAEIEESPAPATKVTEESKEGVPIEEEDEDDYYDEPANTENEMSMLQMLRQHHHEEDEAEEVFGTGFDEEEY